jgi:hypothetical protein
MTSVTVRTGPDRLAEDWACRECRSTGEAPAVHRRSVAPGERPVPEDSGGSVR